MENINYKEKLSSEYGNLTYSVKTFGCQMNINDSMKIKTIMKECGFDQVDDIEACDIAIVNTCCVRENAENKVHGLVGNIKRLKSEGKNKILVVMGCMMQQVGYAAEFMDTNPQVDIALGTSDSQNLPEPIYNALKSKRKLHGLSDPTKPINESIASLRKPRASEFVTIMTGCNNFCTYCVVPYVRGRERSRTPNSIIDEINELSTHGTKEIVLLGQNVNSYGIGLDDECDFSDLIWEITKNTDMKRIRYMTSHPKDLSSKLIETMATNPMVCKHVHLPMQSGSTKVLKEMNRKYTREYYYKLTEDIKKAIPDVSLTTDIIVGFPGESDSDFLDTLDMVKSVEFASAFMFKYSKRTGTEASQMPNQVDEKIKSFRHLKLLNVQDIITKKIAKSFIGKTESVYIESADTSNGQVIGKTSQNISVHIENVDNLIVGSIVNVKINRIRKHTLIGEIEIKR